MEQNTVLQQMLDPSVAHLSHVIGFFGNRYQFWIRELAMMPVHVDWYNEPHRISHFVFQQPIPENLLHSDARVRYQRFVTLSRLEWDAGIIPTRIESPERLLGIMPGQRIYCYTPFIANICQQLFPTVKVFDIQDIENVNIKEYPSEEWTCPFPPHNPKPAKCVMKGLSRMYNWFYTEPNSQVTVEYESEQ